MTELLVTDRSGALHRIVALPEATLMEALRNAELGIAAICGGMLSCGTCHVYLEDAALSAAIAPPGEDEAALASALRHYVAGRSRIACQIPLRAVPDGLLVTVAPEE
jgi:2Fe-2S ferredoxin